MRNKGIGTIIIALIIIILLGLILTSSGFKNFVHPITTTTVTPPTTITNHNNIEGNYTLYVVNNGDNTVSVINLNNMRVVAKIDVDNAPFDAVITPDGKYVYVISSESDTTFVIDTTTNQISARIKTGIHPLSLAVSPDSKYLYILNWSFSDVNMASYNFSLSIINIYNNTIVRTMKVMNEANSVAVSPDGEYIYVGGFDYVWVINATNYSVVKSLSVEQPNFSLPIQLLIIDSNGGYLYAGAHYGISTISIKNNTVVSFSQYTGLPYFSSMAVDPHGRYLYVSHYYLGQGHFLSTLDRYTLINGTLTNLKSIDAPIFLTGMEVQIGFTGMAISPDGKLLFIASNNTVSIVSESTGSIIGNIPVGTNPESIVIKS